MRLVDPRVGRFEQAVVVVILLFGFVFQAAWTIPLASVVAALAALLGPRSPLARLWATAVAPRRPSRAPFEPAAVAQRQSFLLLVGLLLATLLFFADAITLASVVAGAVAVVGAL